MKLSIIIVNYNVAYFLEQCLQSVQRAIVYMDNKYGEHSTEVFVVDNQSVDGSNEMVESRFSWVKLIKNSENVGFSKANNQAIRIATGEYILLLNPDTVIEEDTLIKVVQFMDDHPDAGGLGVKMVDGKGNFLPESKRGLPTPWVAFYKIFGLSALFPRSKRFGRYHLGFLNKDEIHEVEILAGAFMLMRKSALDKVGLLDEDFFMYGEDIDLSWRIIKGGYKNYYFPLTRIIHYKGESTKKSSVNYVFVFYRAMIIFARKHFAQHNARVFSFLIHLAIYLRAAMAVLQRIVKLIAFPALDACLIYAAMLGLTAYWEQNHKYVEGGGYPMLFKFVFLPVYVLIWIIAVYINAGYERPYKTSRIVRGVAWGTLFILVLYALLPEAFRFSRAIILFGSLLAVLVFMTTRIVTHFMRYKNLAFEQGARKRVMIVGSEQECRRVEELIRTTQSSADIIGYVSPHVTTTTLSEKHLGNVSQVTDLISIYQVQEVIFCAKDITSSQIIDQMSLINVANVDFKIAPPESEFIIGSNSIHRSGELYVVDLNAINKPVNRRNKRLLDILLSVIFLLLAPVLWIIQKQRVGFFKNVIEVLAGNKTWVSYAFPINTYNDNRLPKIKPGVLHPADARGIPIEDTKTLRHLDMLYAKDYNPSIDLNIIIRNLRNLGRN
ncbi:MAG: glycosyltransferase family 2 protein [Flavobacteriales bacterium]|nr:glycosyltransferase family 2 protein [Flavobacteriales bacterium]